jgi:scyllo-inositol 2-dehydrogenase (NADP+)
VIRTGLVGYGLAGKVFHEPLIGACERLELSGVLTSREHRLKVSSMDELLSRSDLVVIASPNQTHYPLAKAALQKGRHVVVDKPFTVTLDEADDLITLASGLGLVLTVFHNRRWDGDFLTVKDVLPELGDIFLFEANWDRFRPEIKEGWREDEGAGSGLLSDLGPHLLDQALRLFGPPSEIAADIIVQRPDARVDDYFDIALHHGRTRICLRSSTLVASPRARFAAHGSHGSFVKHGLDPQEAQLKGGMDPRDPEFGIDVEQGVLTLSDGQRRLVPTRRGNYRAFYEAVADTILEGAPVPVPPQEAREALLLIDLARRAAAEERLVAVPDASSKGG